MRLPRSVPHLHALLLLAAVLPLAGCSGDAAKPARVLEGPQDTVSRVGDVTLRANVVRTDGLNPTMARIYGIERDECRALLMVSVRKGPDSRETALRADIVATATDLAGERRDIPMREVRTGDLVDYIGTVAIAAPDTLRFDVSVRREDGAVSRMQFSRDFLPP